MVMRIKSFAKLIIVFCCLFIVAIFVSGCDRKTYRGKYPDLYTVAINSVLWNAGHSMGSDFAQQSEIEILEKDAYGRILFTYFESANAKSNLIVSQGSQDGYAYYYEDYNFLTKNNGRQKAEFTEEEKDYLKSINDWDKEVDFGKCVKKKIVKVKQNIPCDTKVIEERIIQYFDASGKIRWMSLKYLTEDSIGNFIIYGQIHIHENDMPVETNLVVLVKAGCEDFEFFTPTEIYNYQDEFKNFKEQNGWVK